MPDNAFSNDDRPADLSGNSVSNHAPRLLELVNDLVLSISATDRKLLYLNPTAESIFGRSADELLSVEGLWLDCIHEDDREKLISDLTSSRLAKPIELEFRIIQPTGETRFLRANLCALNANGQTPEAIACVATDVTHGIQAEFELEDSKAIYHSLVESLPVNVFRKDRDGRIVFVNNMYCKTLGRSKEDLIGKNDFDLFVPELAEKYQRDDRWVLQTGLPFHDIEFHQSEDNEYTYVEVLKAPVASTAGRRIGIQGMFWDVTERKKAQIDLEKAKDMAEAASTAKSHFLANVSHEIRTPLNAVIGMTDLLLGFKIDKTQKEYLQMIEDSGQSLLALINDILDFSKIESGKLQLDSEWFDLRDSLEDTLRTLAFRAHSKNIDLVCNIDPEIPTQVLGDPHRLRQVIVNLVGNSIKFTATGDVCMDVERVAISDDDVTLRFQIQDTGIGIAEEKLKEIFDEFVQADTSTTRKYGGTGLGLTIASNLVSLMGGELAVNSKLQVGSEFHFTLRFPITNQTQLPFAPEEFNDVPILVMVKNPNLLESLETILKSWRIKTFCVRDNEQGLKLARGMTFAQQSIRLVLAEANDSAHSIDPNCDCSILASCIFEDPEIKNPRFISLIKASSAQGLEIQDDSLECYRVMLPVKHAELRNAIAHCLAPDNESLTTEQATVTDYRGPYRILLAEDNPINQKLAEGILSKYGHTLMIAENGRQAVELLAAGAGDKFDLVLMDVQMPEMDGIEATRLIRASSAADHGNVPIIAMTAHALPADRQRCLEAGMDDYISKPFKAIELVETIDRLMGSRSREILASTQQTTESKAGINWTDAFATVGGDRDLLRDLITIFLTDKDKMLQSMRLAFEESDLVAGRRTAHSMKGTLHHLGMKKLAMIAEKIENFEDQNMDRAFVLCDELEKHINKLTDELVRFTNSI